jgi:hypothetical protein
MSEKGPEGTGLFRNKGIMMNIEQKTNMRHLVRHGDRERR